MVMEKCDVSPHGPKICGETSGDVMFMEPWRHGSPFNRLIPAILENFILKYDGAKSRIEKNISAGV